MEQSRTTTAVHPSIAAAPIPTHGADLPTVCVLCSHNCGIRVDVADNRITAVRPDKESPITHGYICNKAVTIVNYVEHDQRVQYPMRRRGDGTFERIDWDTAIAEIAVRLSAIRSEHGPRSIGLVGVGGQANHIGGPFALGFLKAIGSRRWYNAFAQEKTQHCLVDFWMMDAPPTGFLHPDLERTQYLLVLGTNPKISNRGHNATDFFREMAKDPARKVVVLDPRVTETTKTADRHLRVRPGGDVYFLIAMAAAIVQRELYDAAFLQDRTSGFDQLRDVLTRIDVDEMGRRAGLASADILSVAEEFARAEAASVLYDLGVEMTPFSTLNSYLIRVLLALTGNLAREGGNVFYSTVAPSEWSKNRFEEPERALASGIPAIRALGNAGMFSPTLVPEEVMLDHPERLRAIIVDSSNPYLSYSDTNAWREARKKLDLLVVIEPAFTETARDADYVLPAPTGYEKWEMALFPKGYPDIPVQVRPPVVAGPPEARTEGEIYIRILEAMGLVEAPPQELLSLVPMLGTPEGRGFFLGVAMSLLGDVAKRGIDPETQLLAWSYRLLGPVLASPSLVPPYVLSQKNAMLRRDDVLRALGQEHAAKNPFELGEEIFARIMAHPEGVVIARTELGTNFEQHVNFPDKRVRLAIPEMLAELERAATARREDPAYPFILANGLRTRWTANTIQRDPKWRKGSGPHCSLSIHPGDAARLGIGAGDLARLETNRAAVILPVVLDEKLMSGHVSMPNGFGTVLGKPGQAAAGIDGANGNELTDVADRDPFTGIPHHRYVRCRIAKAEQPSAA
ncbi:MAG TPA: molybdopterin-dependent oxidoreductase [Candidatus Limnocylindrales bacterium]|nr:molybdopterin-dependent oxidoreductase [Candidatus Limnocylindrales bacterium]